MAADASIYSLIKPQPGPMEQYGQVLNLKALMGQGKLQDLQTQKAERDMAEEQALHDVFSKAPEGSTLESLVPAALRASPKGGIDLQGKVLAQKKNQADLDKTGLEIAAAKAKDARDGLAGVNDQVSYDAWRQSGAQKGYQVAQSAPEVFDPKWQQQHVLTADQFIANIEHQRSRDVTTAGQNLTRQSAQEHNDVLTRGQDMTDSRLRESNGNFGGKSGELLGALAERGVSIPAGFRSRAQIATTLESLVSRNPGKSVDEIADMLKAGQIGFGAEKKETQTAAAVAGRVGVAGEEIAQFAPLVEEASKNVPRGQFVPINKLMQTGEASISDPNLKKLKVYINSTLNAYDQLAARGGTDKDKRAEAHALLTSAESHEALMAGLDAFKKEVSAAQRAADIASRPRSERDAARKDGAPTPAAAPKVPPGKLTQPVKFLGFE